MGMLVVLDHGGGYLSLYGQNEQLYRKVGDTVAPGDLLASLGETGSSAELYLEIRKGKQPLDPQRWLRK
jgi:septal ring factor EnvC (AmiA/AmiB activator)